MIAITITLTEFLLIALFGMAVLVTIGMLVIIRQHRNQKPGNGFFKRHGIEE